MIYKKEYVDTPILVLTCLIIQGKITSEKKGDGEDCVPFSHVSCWQKTNGDYKGCVVCVCVQVQLIKTGKCNTQKLFLRMAGTEGEINV